MKDEIFTHLKKYFEHGGNPEKAIERETEKNRERKRIIDLNMEPETKYVRSVGTSTKKRDKKVKREKNRKKCREI